MSRARGTGTAAAPGHPVRSQSVSATLGWLYLEQGYVDEAAAIFERVVGQSPGDPRVLEGRHEVDRRRRVERKLARLRLFLARVEQRAG